MRYPCCSSSPPAGLPIQTSLVPQIVSQTTGKTTTTVLRTTKATKIRRNHYHSGTRSAAGSRSCRSRSANVLHGLHHGHRHQVSQLRMPVSERQLPSHRQERRHSKELRPMFQVQPLICDFIYCVCEQYTTRTQVCQYEILRL